MNRPLDLDPFEYQKGSHYLDRITTLASLRKYYSASVAGSGRNHYEVDLFRVEDKCVHGHCTCPAFSNYSECKHIAAVALRGEGEFFLKIKNKQEFIPIEAFEVDDFKEEALGEDRFYGQTRGKEGRADALRNFTQLASVINIDNKEERLNEFYYPADTSATPPAKIWFQLRLPDHGDEDLLELQLFCQNRLKSGKLGKVKEFWMTNQILGKLNDPDQRELFRQLALFAEWRQNYHMLGSEFTQIEFPIKSNEALIIQLVKGGHCFWDPWCQHGRPGEVEENLVKFIEGPWHIRLKIDSDNRSVIPKLVREDVELELERFQQFEGVALCINDGQVMECHSHSFDFILLHFLSEFEGETFDEDQWELFKKTLLSNYSHSLIGGDRFRLPLEQVSKSFEVYLKWSDDSDVQGKILDTTQQQSLEKLIIVDEANFQDFIKKIKSEVNLCSLPADSFAFSYSDLFNFVSLCQKLDVSVFFKKQKLSSASSFNMQVHSGIDWLEIKGELELDTQTLNLAAILKTLDLKSNTVALKNGTLGILPKEWQEKLRKLKRHTISTKDHLQLHPAKALLLQEDISKTENLDLDHLMARLQSFKEILPLKEETSFKGELRSYQRFALGWLDFLTECRLGGILADEMGLGKTVQVTAFLQRNYNDIPDRKTLIVCPKSLTSNWQKEIHKFAPELSTYIWETGTLKNEHYQHHQIIICSYQLLQRDKNFAFSFDYLVMDEAQMVKNPKSLTHKSVLQVQAKFKLALTGTPVENHLGDLMSIFNIVIPKLFNHRNLKDLEEEDLNFMRPFLLRRTKDEVLTDLPEKTIQTLLCKPTKNELKTYQSFHAAMKMQLDGDWHEENSAKFNFLQILTKLRQAACDLRLVDSSQKGGSAKVEMLRELVEEIHQGDNKVVIFSQFTSFLKLIKEDLKLTTENSCYLDGQTKRREEVVQRFSDDPEVKTFLISIKAGGVGLNLTNASYCIIVDPWWNPAVEAQAMDRLHRIGQKSRVTAYRLITEGSIEEKVDQLQGLKKELYKKVLGSTTNFIKNLSPADMNFLME